MTNCPVSEAEIKRDQWEGWSDEMEQAYDENEQRMITENVDDILGTWNDENIDNVTELIANNADLRLILMGILCLPVSEPILLKEARSLVEATIGFKKNVERGLRDYVEVE